LTKDASLRSALTKMPGSERTESLGTTAAGEPDPRVRVLICGNYGRGAHAINGQTIKTRVLRDALVGALGDRGVSVLDTSSVFRKPLSFYAAARKGFFECTHIILLPGPLAVHVLLPLFLRWRKKHARDIRYVVIGGWLPGLLAKNRRLRAACMQLDGIYVETHAMADSMRALGFLNVHMLPNFRLFDPNMPRSYAPTCPPLRLVFCARVFKEKGIEEAIAAVERLNADRPAPVVSLDVYGPVTKTYEKRFHELVGSSSGTTYKGILEPVTMYSVLQRYDLMLFPTYYPDEGFPGTILDAFISGVPVLASDWKYNREFIDQGRTGILCTPRSCDDLVTILEGYVDTPQLLSAMRQHCIEQAEEYHVDHALKDLLLHVANSSRVAEPSALHA
jgi:glycosyltransferase involved in cell wall biosynthesis